MFTKCQNSRIKVSNFLFLQSFCWTTPNWPHGNHNFIFRPEVGWLEYSWLVGGHFNSKILVKLTIAIRSVLCSSSSVFLRMALRRSEYLVRRCIGRTRISISRSRLQSLWVSHHCEKRKYHSTSEPAFLFWFGYACAVKSKALSYKLNKSILALYSIFWLSAKWDGITHLIDIGLFPSKDWGQ